MSAWHRNHPELVGTGADPWMRNEGYQKALPTHLSSDAPPCGCEAPHHDLDGVDRARDDAREDVWDRRERESLEQERREEREW